MPDLRPNQILDLYESENNYIDFILPKSRSEFFVLDLICLTALAKYLNPQNIFQFGTYWGEGAYILAKNTDAKVTTIDLKEQPLYYCDQMKNVSRIIGDSQLVDLSNEFSKFQIVYIDGGVTLDCIKSDTENALRLISGQKRACIVWCNWYFNEQTNEYLNKTLGHDKIYTVIDTHLSIYPVGFSFAQPCSETVEELLPGVDRYGNISDS
jgi:hypothetical protein